MPYTITLTDDFLDGLLTVPREVANKVSLLTRKLKDNPRHPEGFDTRHLQRNQHQYRVRLGDHRIIYAVANHHVVLQVIGDRGRCYRQIPDPILYEENCQEDLDFLLTPSSQGQPSQANIPLITEEKLCDLRVPEAYWDSVLALNTQELLDKNLLHLRIPEQYISRILNHLYPSTIEREDSRKKYVVTPEQIDSFLDDQTQDFLLMLGGDQRRIAELEGDSAILVKGAPGTGKTIVAIHRIKYFIEKGHRRILFTTHNESLVNYCKQLLKSIPELQRPDVPLEVVTVDDLASRVYKKAYGETRIPSDGGLFLLRSIFDENKDLERSRKQILSKINYSYILDEINLVIEARDINLAQEYLATNRYGRGLGLNNRQRKLIWEIYSIWRARLLESGYISLGELRKRALEVVKSYETKKFDAVVIDEAQDLSPVALRFLATLIDSPKNLYLTADTSQSLYQLGFSWNYIQASLSFKGKIRCLRHIYRTTSAIAEACFSIIQHSDCGDPDTFVAASQLFSSERPKIILRDDWLRNSANDIKEFLVESAQRWRLSVYSSAILCPSPILADFIAQNLRILGLNSHYIVKDNDGLERPFTQVMDIHASKGLEFPFVVVFDLQEEHLLNDDIPVDEREEVRKNQMRLFYVGCSRAMRSLLVIGSKSRPSRFIESRLNDPKWSIIRG